MKEFALKSLPDITEPLPTNSALESWIMSDGFAAPKVTLFSSKEETPSVYKNLAVRFKDANLKYVFIIRC